MNKRFLALLLALCLMLPAAPVGALAEPEVIRAGAVEAAVDEMTDAWDLDALDEIVGDETVDALDGLELDQTEGAAELPSGFDLLLEDEDLLYGEPDENLVFGTEQPGEAPEVEAVDETANEAPEGEADGNPAETPDADDAETPDEASEPDDGEASVDPAEAPAGDDAGEVSDFEEAPASDAEATQDGEEDEAAPEGEVVEAEDSEETSEATGEAAAESEGDSDAQNAVAEASEADDDSEKTVDAEGVQPAGETPESTEGQADGEIVMEEQTDEAAKAEAPEALTAPETALTLDRTAERLMPGDTFSLAASGGTGAVDWTSDNAAVATVDAQGTVTAVAAGSATITATDGADVKASCVVTVVDVPDDVAFATDSLILGLKEKRQLPRLVWDGGAKPYKGTVTYATGASGTVTVTADGQARAVARGSAAITATLSDGRAVTLNVTVKKAPKRIDPAQKKRSMGVGETITLGYRLPSGTGGGVSWSSGNPAVATVDVDTGAVTAVAQGTAKITARTYNNKRAAVTVSVFAAPTSVAFEGGVVEVGLGETAPLSAVVNDGAYSNFSFVTADSGIASVNGGKVTGAALGETDVTVTTYNGLTATAKLIVKPAPAYISLPYKTLKLGKGDRVKLRADLGDGASTLICSSNKKKIVKATSDGWVKGLRRGTAYVTVRTYNNRRARLKVVVKSAPGWISAKPSALSLGVGETYTLGYKTPAGTAGSVRFAGDAPEVFTVNETTGEITGLAAGSGTVTLTSFNGKIATCPVTVYPAPTEIAFDESRLSAAKKEKVQLAVKFNEGSWSNVTYEIDNPAIAKVSASGVVTGLKVGQTTVRAKTFLPNVYAEAVFTVWGAPSRVWLDQKTLGATVGEPLQLEPRIPVGSRTTFKYKSSNTGVATVDENGLVTPLAKGVTTITITTHNKKKVSAKLTVSDPGAPNTLALKDDNIPALRVGETWQAEYTFSPETADGSVTWSSSNTAVATVDANGLVTAVGYGVTTIKAVSVRNSQLSLKFTLAVQTKDLSLTIPARTTDVSGISANLKLIDDIRASAISEINRLKSEGDLSASSASRRKEIVNAIFENYAFPWMTPTLQKYWKAANSENGAKDFKTDRVYYGMPYISGSGANRRYSAALALSEGRYTDSGMGYYLLNQNKYLNGKYVGNDCSGLVNISIWGTGSSHAADRTDDIFVSSAYSTVSSYNDMLPGDLICKGSAHVVMFLYYASADKSKIMIIENGGSEKGTNTVHCDIKTASAYKNSGYRVRRLASL